MSWMSNLSGREVWVLMFCWREFTRVFVVRRVIAERVVVMAIIRIVAIIGLRSLLFSHG